MGRNSPTISELYQSDLERHLFAPESRSRRRPRQGRLPGWLSIAAALVAWGLSFGR
jgi:hypothetical protein